MTTVTQIWHQIMKKGAFKIQTAFLNIWSSSNSGKVRMLNLSMHRCTVSISYLQTTMPSVMSGVRMTGCKSWGRNKTSWLDDEASHFSSRELMITCRSSGLLHLHANWLLGLASSWQAPVFSALSSPRSTKESLEVFYLCLRVQFLVCQERNSTN